MNASIESSPYVIDDVSRIASPAMLVFRDLVDGNLDEMVRIAGTPDRLRPHCKTHKMAELTKRQLARGITRHKAATLAEAEMLADAGADDVLLAYNLVGPNIERAVAFRRRFPDVDFSVTADHPDAVDELSSAMWEANTSIGVLLDVDCGMHRTGIELGDEAEELYRLIEESPGLDARGLHVYDGHTRHPDLGERIAAIRTIWSEVSAFRDRLWDGGLPVDTIVAGGTPSFNAWSTIDDPDLELSPGTCVLHDHGYGTAFPDQDFTPAGLLLTRVVSRPTADTMTLDLGTKAVASDPPHGGRVFLPDLPNAEQVKQNEEHLVLRTPQAEEYAPGDVLLAIPTHVCPTSALHDDVWVVADGVIVGRWEVTARSRRLTI